MNAKFAIVMPIMIMKFVTTMKPTIKSGILGICVIVKSK
jgi:hypothetical protein